MRASRLYGKYTTFSKFSRGKYVYWRSVLCSFVCCWKQFARRIACCLAPCNHQGAQLRTESVIRLAYCKSLARSFNVGNTFPWTYTRIGAYRHPPTHTRARARTALTSCDAAAVKTRRRRPFSICWVLTFNVSHHRTPTDWWLTHRDTIHQMVLQTSRYI